jgi:diguanylate cyclase (GGDEF)-like protein/PAS domain S-box-containing protein
MHEGIAVQFGTVAGAGGSAAEHRSHAVGPHPAVPSPEQRLAEIERELASVQAALHTTLDNVDQGIACIDPDGYVVICSRKVCELLDLPHELMARKPHFDEVVAHQLAKRDFPGCDEDFQRTVVASGIANSPPVYERTRPNGVTIEVRTVHLPDGGAVRTYTDVTQRKAREAKLAAAEAEYRGLFENAAVGIYRSSLDGRQLRANPALVRLHGYAGEAEMLAAVNDAARDWYVDPARRETFLTLMRDQGRVTDFVSEVVAHRTREHIWVSETVWTVPGSDGTPAFFEGMVVDATERRRAEERIAHLAHHDALTGLPNRVLFAEEMRRVLGRDAPRFAVLCIDLDRFKEVNDTLGHGTGDALLRAAGRRLARCVREGDVVARLGGDEFAVIQSDVTLADDAGALAGRIVEQLGRPYMITGHRVIIGASVGIALAPNDGVEAEALLRHADVALYRAKDTGRGTFAFFEAPMVEALREKRAIEMDLRVAMERGELQLVYQPIVDLGTARPVAYEALLRWSHPTRGSISPGQFVPIAEETGQMPAIGAWVLREACREAALARDPVTVSVNLSAAQFQSGDLVATVAEALRASDLEARRLMLEITESILLMDDLPAIEALRALQARGVRVALDDFGTGQSSLGYLQAFPFDRIKIDQSFIARLGSQSTNAAVVRAVIGLGRDLGMPVIAEGVESEAQLATLVAEGCGLVQGYLFGRPAPATMAFGRAAAAAVA